MNRTDDAMRYLEDTTRFEDEIGAMCMSVMFQRRKQLGGDIPTANDYRRLKQMVGIAMDAQPVSDGRNISASDAPTKALSAVDHALTHGEQSE